jgi:hypothetical protein
MDPRLMVVKNQKTIFDHCLKKNQRIDQETCQFFASFKTLIQQLFCFENKKKKLELGSLILKICKYCT